MISKNFLNFFSGGGSVEAYEGVMWCLLWRLEHLETELAVVRSEWDAVIGEYDTLVWKL